jgi:hypothetical protein
LELNWKNFPKIHVFLVRDSIKFFQLEFLEIHWNSKNSNGFLGIPRNSNWKGWGTVKTSVEPHNTDDLGYPEAKWVCEQILLKANELFGVKTDNLKMPLLRTSSIRIGQMTGPEQSGTWNETEDTVLKVYKT